MNYLELVNEHFGFLIENRDYVMVSHTYDADASGNFIVVYRRGEMWLKLIPDRSQVLVEFSHDGEYWQDKEMILETQGISMDRYSHDEVGLWSGYEIENQAKDLRAHLDLIEKVFGAGGAA